MFQCMSDWRKFLWMLFPALLLLGCSTAGTKKQAPAVESRATAPREGVSGAEATGARRAGEFEGSPMNAPPGSPLSKHVVYFDFDRSDVREEDRPVVEAHAQYLSAHPQVKVILEGHTDERGTREYNLALGERRAIAVRQLMTVLGVGAGQIQVVSYGEEKPAAEGHDEEAWRLNRRVEITYPAS
jgi:peptidoglycan-associated lipoprotein